MATSLYVGIVLMLILASPIHSLWFRFKTTPKPDRSAKPNAYMDDPNLVEKTMMHMLIADLFLIDVPVKRGGYYTHFYEALDNPTGTTAPDEKEVTNDVLGSGSSTEPCFQDRCTTQTPFASNSAKLIASLSLSASDSEPREQRSFHYSKIVESPIGPTQQNESARETNKEKQKPDLFVDDKAVTTESTSVVVPDDAHSSSRASVASVLRDQIETTNATLKYSPAYSMAEIISEADKETSI